MNMDHKSLEIVLMIFDPRLSFVKSVFDCRLSGVVIKLFHQQKHEKCILFLALVSDCFGLGIFSIFNKHTAQVAIKYINTIKESSSKICRNRVFDCRLSTNLLQIVIDNTVSSDLLSAFMDCSEHFQLPLIWYDKGTFFMVIFLHKTLVTKN